MPFVGTERFEVVKKLGSGSFGTVFEVVDRETSATCALKILDKVDADSLVRFKHEFRSLAGFRHPNVAFLLELLNADGSWFYTMELIRGSELLEYLARQEILRSLEGSAMCQPGQLTSAYVHDVRAALTQLVDAIAAIHAFGKLHRDIKPSNIVVTDEGRVVLLDFGLVREIGQYDFDETMSLVGTPGYMSPEQVSGGAITETSDWYAFGIVLFQALTGSLPFNGSFFEIAVAQRTTEAPPPSDLVQGLPREIDDLCRRLLRANPEERPASEEIRAILTPPEMTYWLPAIRTRRLGHDQPFIGREKQLSALDEELERVERGESRVIFLHGSSGVGKTALVNHYLDRARGRKEVNILASRCYSGEVLPFRGIDGIVDSIARLFSKGIPPPDDVEPEEVTAAMEAFPILQEIGPLLRRRSAQPAADSGFGPLASFLRKVLGHLATRRTTIIFIDDTQWGDFPSGKVLKTLYSIDRPPVLLILAYTSEDAQTSLLLQTFRSDSLAGSTILEVPSLNDAEALQFARSRAGEVDEQRVGRLVGDARGNLFFLQELVNWLREHPDSDFTLESVMTSRFQTLPRLARRIVQIVVREGSPIDVQRLTEQLGTSDITEELALLRHQRWIRSRFTGDFQEVEVYHANLRDLIL